MSTDEYVPTTAQVRGRYSDGAHFQGVPEEYDDQSLAAFDAWIARVRRDAWDACYHQMVTAPARGVIVTEKSNPYAPERRVTP